jgi:hypothetical protein
MEAEPHVIGSSEIPGKRESRFDLAGRVEALQQVSTGGMGGEREDLAGDPKRADAELVAAFHSHHQSLRVMPGDLADVTSRGS